MLVRDFFLPAHRVGGGSGKKFSLHAKNGPKSAFWGSLGEFCTGWACQGRLLGEFCTGWACQGRLRGEFCTGWAAGVGVLGEFCTGFGSGCGTKFSLLGVVVVRAVHSSPCSAKTRGNGPFGACGESFVPGLALGAVQSSPCSAKTRGNGPFGACGESFVPVGLLVWVCWESFVPGEPLDRLNRGSLVPGGPVRLLVMSVCLRVRSACGYLLSGWEKFRMQFPLRYFKL